MNTTPSTAMLEHVHCPACGPAGSTVWMNGAGATRYLRCHGCGTVYASPRAPQEQRLAWLDASFGLGPAAEANAAARRPALAREATLIQRHITGGRMLDVGCDLGTFFEWFPASRWQRYGVEIAASAAAYAAQATGARVVAGTLEHAGYPDGFFDLVTLIDMLYHVDDPRAELYAAARVLRPGGVLAIELCGQAYQLARSRGLLCWLFDRRWTRLRSDSSHLFWLTPKALETLVHACGCAMEATYVVPSPDTGRGIRPVLAALHYAFLSSAARRVPGLVTWAPKYLLIARRQEDPR